MMKRILLLLLVACSAPQEISFGVLSDIHGYYDHVEEFVDQFDVDGIIITGDIAEHVRSKPHNLTDYKEIYKSLEVVASLGVPVYVIPGNHDMREDYKKAISELSLENIVDMSVERKVELSGVVIVSNPYGTDFTYDSEGYKGTARDVEYISSIVSGNKPVLLISHQPPKSKGSKCIDVVFDGDNVGDMTLNKVIRDKKIPFVVSGHIHEAGGRACTADGSVVASGSYVKEMRFNPGSVMPWKYLDGKEYRGRAGILTFRGNEAKFEVIEI